MFLSLKKHWEGSSPELTNALLQFCHLLLRSMRLHVVQSEETELHRFQSAVLHLEQRVGTAPEPAEVLLVAGEAAKTFEEYSHQTNRFLQVQHRELTTMMGMLTSTVTSISAASQTAVAQLGKVEKRIEHISYATDLPKLKAELADCLAMVREEAFRQRERNAATIHTLQRGVSDTRRRITEVAAERKNNDEPQLRDELTNLPARADAEDALFQSRNGKNIFAAVLPVDRLALVNIRFGTQSTDVVVKFFAEYLRQHLQPKDRLFRWSPNAFLALVERDQPQDSVRADLSRFASSKMEVTLEHHGRELLLPVSSTWVLFATGEGRTHEALVEKIDGFLKSEMHVKDSF
ncbi:MAG: diguanylate cyclase domain-containing protein [Bryobacteraceae bacterium]